MESLLPYVREAADAICSVYAKSKIETALKEDRSPLTEADRASQRILLEGISAIAPGIPILSEEMEAVPYSERKDWELYFLIDPLDGTREFVKRIPEFAINVALIRKGRPVQGIVHSPLDQISYVAEEGSGAYRFEKDQRIRLPQIRKDREVRILISRTDHSAELDALLSLIPGGVVQRTGSSLKFCRVAEGAADFYPRLKPSMEWDTAAGTILVQESGGQLTRTDGSELLYNREILLNPPFFATGRNFEEKVPDAKRVLFGSSDQDASGDVG